jgi:hypothetical protein
MVPRGIELIEQVVAAIRWECLSVPGAVAPVLDVAAVRAAGGGERLRRRTLTSRVSGHDHVRSLLRR